MPGTAPPGGAFPWYAVIMRERGSVTARVLSALEWRQDQNPQSPDAPTFTLIGGYNTHAEAQAAADKYNAQSNVAKLKQAGVNTAPDFPNPLHGVEAIGDFFHRLTEASTWTRVGEVLLGGILVYAGVRALAHGSPTVGVQARKSATRPVSKVAKAAVTVAAPEARLASRAVSKKVAPKATAKVAAHRAHAAKYGAKKPYSPPEPKPPRITYRHSIIEHRKAPTVTRAKPKPKPKVTK